MLCKWDDPSARTAKQSREWEKERQGSNVHWMPSKLECLSINRVILLSRIPWLHYSRRMYTKRLISNGSNAHPILTEILRDFFLCLFGSLWHRKFVDDDFFFMQPQIEARASLESKPLLVSLTFFLCLLKWVRCIHVTAETMWNWRPNSKTLISIQRTQISHQ